MVAPRYTPTFSAACAGISMTCAGDEDESYKPAIGADSRAKQSSIANAAVISRTRLLYTTTRDTSRIAVERVFEYIWYAIKFQN